MAMREQKGRIALGLGLLVASFFAACTHLSADRRTNAVESAKPTRVLLLLFDAMQHKVPDGSPQAGLRRLRSRAVFFPEAAAGLVPTLPLVAFSSLWTGLLPRKLPWQDVRLDDRAGSYGPPERLYNVPGASSLNSQLVAGIDRSRTLPELLREGHGAPRLFLETWAGAPLAALWSTSFDSATSHGGDPFHQVARAVSERVRDPRGFRLIVGHFPAGDLATQDRALTEVLDAIDSDNAWRNTVVVVTAASGLAPTAPASKSVDVRDALKGVPLLGLIEDTSIRIWLRRKDRPQIAQIARRLAGVADISEVFSRRETEESVQYVRSFRRRDLASNAWTKERLPAALQSSLGPGAADLVAFRGNTAETAGRIPLWMWDPRLGKNLQGSTGKNEHVTLVDVLPATLKLLGISIPEDLDGTDDTLYSSLGSP